MTQDVTVFVAFLAAIGPVAILITKVVDGIRDMTASTWRDKPWVWNVAALALGVAYALVLQFDAVQLIPGVRASLATGVAGQIITGLSIGAAADYWHKTLAQKSAKATQVPPPRG